MTASDKGCAKTDSRLRPDKNLMENGEWDEADQLKVALEDAQRSRRRTMEANRQVWKPLWFEKKADPAYPARQVHQFKVWCNAVYPLHTLPFPFTRHGFCTDA